MNLTVLYKKYKHLRYFTIVVIVSILWLIWFWYCDYTLFAWQTETNVSWKWTATCQASSPLLCLKGGGSVNFWTNWMANLDSNNSVCFGSDNRQSIVSVNYDIWYWWTIICQSTASSNMTESQCISMYWLVSSSDYNTLSWNLATCQSNLNNCQNNSSDCSDTESLLQSCNIDLQTCLNWELSWNNRSALFINEIQHLGAWIININIPEEFEWNYKYLTGDEIETMTIDIEGYGYDQEKMQKMVNTQFAEMNNEDLANLISKIADFIPLIAITWLFIRVRYIIKKRIFRK